MEERKQHLIEKLRSTKGSRLKGSASESKIASSSFNVKPRWRKFEIGWLHFSEEKGRYLAVRQSTGGGTRSISRLKNGGSIGKWRLDWKLEARLENGGSIGKWRLDWKMEARLRNRASFVAEWQNEVSWSF